MYIYRTVWGSENLRWKEKLVDVTYMHTAISVDRLLIDCFTTYETVCLH